MGQGFISKYILRGIADFIRGRKNTTAEIKPVDMVAELESIPTYEQGIEQGKQAEYNRFWSNHAKPDNNYGFHYKYAGAGWNNETLYPPYDIVPDGKIADGMFTCSGFVGDLQERFDELGIVMDISKATRTSNFLQNSLNITRVGVIDASSSSSILAFFGYCMALVTVDKFIVRESHAFTSTFVACTELTNIIFEGVIGQNGLDLHWSTKLSKASIESIVGCLSTTTSGLSITLPEEAVKREFTDEEWAELVASRPNWTISLV